MIPQADSIAMTLVNANGHSNGAAEAHSASVYDILNSSDNPTSFYSTDEQRQNFKIASAGCKHLFDMKHQHSIPSNANDRDTFRQTFTTAVDYGIAWKIAMSEARSSGKTDDTVRSKKRKKLNEQLPVPHCTSCQLLSNRLHICLHCNYLGCRSQRHIQQHLKKENHIFAMDFSNQMIYCSLCSDYIYDKELYDLITKPKLLRMYKYLRRGKKNQPQFIDWIPSDSEQKLITTQSSLLPCRGIRGLTNMGNTCFMNVILQSMAHNPLLRAHFLSDRHNYKSCKRKYCMCCEMDKLFEQLYSGERSPYGPCTFLQSMWLSLKELAGYAQQDAHEFFISALNQIHADSKDHSMDDCHCVVHQTFAGLLQSNVTCLKCGNVSSAYDPMLDISLDLLPPEKKKKQITQPLPGDNTGKLGNPLLTSKDKQASSNSDQHQSFFAARRAREANSLTDCLDRYTKPEKLGENQYSCGNCGHTFQAAVKQLSVKRLPQVLSFQLKRFEHGKSATKIETKIKFPIDLDMTPYTTEYGDGSGKHNDKKSHRSSNPPAYNNINVYTLFAVVNHQGKMDTGHYTMFAKHRGQWFKFDDHHVTMSYQKDVLDSKAYMCFYIKKSLDYGFG
ncbi:hypothetical protein BC943DRAFT_51018 [Umbelopsis sp. AD052]|nr:hypothetical protein BC943DRAFT_51018 [Umbelopsis sp. AD052]